jgi:uncharacterized protein (TIGR03790 family)
MTAGYACRQVRGGRNAGFSILVLLALLSSPANSSPAPRTDPAALATIVVYNSRDPESKTLAEYYAGHRNIPTDHIVPLCCPIDEEIDRDDYDATIADPLRNEFSNHHWWDTITGVDLQTRVTANRIRFVALIRGIPLKIRFKGSYVGDHPDPSKPWGMTNEASVDSELAVLGFFTRQISGPIENPYFRSSKPIIAPDTDSRLLLVTRLDGPFSAEVRRIIDDAVNTEKKGLWGWTYIDARGIRDPAYKLGDDWLFRIVDRSLAQGRPVILDRLEAMFPSGYPMTNAMLYFGWYSDRPIGALADPNFRFLPGAIAVPIFSFSASSIRTIDHYWVGPLIHRGAAATIGYVYEPYLSFTAALDIFHDRLVQGMTFAESAYASLLPLSWMSTCVGDPLYRPFGGSDSSSPPRTNPFAVFKDLSKRNSGKPDQLVQDLWQQGPTNPLLFEFAGIVAERDNQTETALHSFERARQHARNQEDKFRALIDELALLLKLERKSEMAPIIEKAEAEFPNPAAHDILKFYKSQ